MPNRHLQIAALTVALLLGAAACGQRVSPRDGEQTDQGQGAETGGGDLRSLAAKWQETSATIRYEQKVEGAQGQGPGGTVTLYWMPPDAWRLDFEGQGTAATTISRGDTTFICGGAQGGGEPSCFKTESTEGAPTGPLFFGDPRNITENLPADAPVERTTTTIAGEEASCFSVTGGQGGPAGGPSEWCFSQDGLLLRQRTSTEGQGAGSVALEAIEISREVSESDFEPPFPVVEAPAPPG